MTAQQLKNSILQLAVQGKLVPQDPNDEPASVLLERISKERERLIKEKKIKKPKSTSRIFRRDGHYYESVNGGEPACIDEQIPFDIPETWEWVRCSALGGIVRGSGIKRSDIVAEGLPCVRYGELYTSYETTFTEALSHIPEPLFDKCKIFSKGAILFTLTGENKPDIGKALAYLGEQPIAAGGDLAFWEYHGLNPEFLVYSLNSPYAVGEKIKKATGDIIVHISGDKIGSILICVPPLSEQQRIVEKIHELLPILSDYGITSTHLAKLDSGFPSSLKKSILQHAIQGKLVPQDPNDEPASVLLARIAQERSKLGKKAAKSMSRIERRDRGTYEIFPDGSEKDISEEIPFDIPDSWEWCRLDMLGDYKKGPFGSSLTKSCFVPKASNSVKVYEQKNAIQKNHILGSYYISSEYFEKAMRSFEVHGGDIIVSCAGTIGETYKLPEEAKSGIINQALMRVRLTPLLCDSFFLMYFDYIVKVQAKESSKGSAIKNIPPFAIFKKLLMPVPPQVEQHRIVEKLGVLMKEFGATK